MRVMSQYEKSLFNSRYAAPGSDEAGWHDVFNRVVSGLSAFVSEKRLPFSLDGCREDIDAGAFVPGSPILWNYFTDRRHSKCGSSCYTGRIGDSLKSFRESDGDAESVYVASGGFGVLCDAVRPRGTHIHHCPEGAMGSMCDGGPVMRIEGTTGYITGSGRARGAFMVQIGVRHPDALEFMLKKHVRAIGWLDDWPTNAEAVVKARWDGLDIDQLDRQLSFISEFSSRYSTARRWPTIRDVIDQMRFGPHLTELTAAGVIELRGGRVTPMVTDWGVEESKTGHRRPANQDWELPRQNCNMSLRFPDSFMRAVELDLPWTFAWFSEDEAGPHQRAHCKTDVEWDGETGLRDTQLNLHVDSEDSSVSLCVDYPPKRYSVVITTWQGLLDNLRPNQNDWRDVDYARFFRTAVQPTIKRYGTGRIMARQVWDAFCRESHDHGDPAAVFSDTYSRWNPTDESVYGPRLSNPCAEYVNPAGGSCNLGSLNLRECADRSAISEAVGSTAMTTLEDWGAFIRPGGLDSTLKRVSEVARRSTRFMTACLEYNEAPVEYISRMTHEDFRTIGIGIMGLAELMMFCHTPYGSPFSLALASTIQSEIALTAWEESFELAKAGMPAPKAWLPQKMAEIFSMRAESASSRGLPAEHVSRWKALSERAARGEVATHTCVTSVAPTGTISQIAGWVTGRSVNSGVEPVFSWNVSRTDNNGKIIIGHDVAADDDHRGKPWMVTAMDGIRPSDHVEVQAAVCAFCCMSVSKTINLPADATVEQLSEVYFQAWKLGIPSTAPYVDGSKPQQVLTALDCPSGECKTTYEEPLAVSTLNK